MAQAWYLYPRIDNYGQPDSFGGFPKPDSNIECPDGTPITAILPGVVSGINTPGGGVPAWGAVVTVKLTTPINSIATHAAYLHLAPLPSNIRVGMRVDVGTLLGHSGGSQAAGSQKVPVGFALYNGDSYGFGPSWGKYLGSPQLNPVPTLDAIKNGLLPQTGSGGSTSVGGAITAAAKNALNPANLAPTVEVTTFLWALDQALLLVNPFNTGTVQQDTIAGVTFTDPIAWLGQFGQNLVDDMAAMMMRLIFLSLGVFVLYKVLSAWIDFGAITNSVVQGGMTIAKGVALAA